MQFIFYQPRLTLTFGLIVAIGCVAYTTRHLEFKTSRQDLLSQDSEFHQRYLAYEREFGPGSDVVVVVEGPSQAKVVSAMSDFGAALRAHPEDFTDVVDRLNHQALVHKGMHFLPEERLERILAFVRRAYPLITDPHVDLAALMSIAELGQEASIGYVAAADSAVAPPALMPEFMLARNGQIGLVLAKLNLRPAGFVPDQTTFRRLERIRRDVQSDHPQVLLGLTGVPLLEFDEMRTSEQDMKSASIACVLGVGLLMWAGFGGLRYPLLGMGALSLGIAWTCGYLTWTVGHLNILSMSFGVILIGLGIDFAVHLIARYLENRAAGLDTYAGLRAAMHVTGPPIAAGGVTTAAAFFATSFTEFQGVAELGVIAGGGVLLCVVATLVMLPAAIAWADANRVPFRNPHLLTLQGALEPLWRRPWRTVLSLSACTLFLSTGLNRLTYDHNLLNLQAEGVSSVVWEHKLLQDASLNSWFAISVADSLDSARQRHEDFRQLASVERVDDLTVCLPPTSDAKRETIRELHQALQQVPSMRPVLQPLSGQNLLDQPGPSETSGGIGPSGGQLLVEMNAQRTLAVDQIWQSLRQLVDISDPEPPQLDDISPGLRSRLLGRSGRYLLRIYPRENVWSMEPLQRFVQQLEDVDARITGDPVQTYYASHQMRLSYLRAAWLAAIAVGIILMIDLRNPVDVLFAAIPTTLGLVQMLGLMGLLGIPLNPANIIVLPLIIGIGIDDGIHVLHDDRQHGLRGRLSRATTTGIVLTSLTSMIGFGSLMCARHQGLNSLGRVVTLGIMCCLITSTVLLPCLLGLIVRRSECEQNTPVDLPAT